MLAKDNYVEELIEVLKEIVEWGPDKLNLKRAKQIIAKAERIRARAKELK